jgi:hypothetical protein
MNIDIKNFVSRLSTERIRNWVFKVALSHNQRVSLIYIGHYCKQYLFGICNALHKSKSDRSYGSVSFLPR